MGGETFETNLTGLHNIYNLTSVILYAQSHHPDRQRLRRAVRQLEMVKRRQEYRGLFQGSPLIDDFAHHPRAVSLTLDNIKSCHPDKNLHAVFEPASATARSSLFQEEFTRALKRADIVTLVRPRSPTTVKNTSDLDVDKLATQLSHAAVVDNTEDLIYRLRESASEKTVILILSNGGMLGLWSALEKDIQ